MLVRLDFYMIPREVIGDYLSEIMAVSGFKIVKPLSMDDTFKKKKKKTGRSEVKNKPAQWFNKHYDII